MVQVYGCPVFSLAFLYFLSISIIRCDDYIPEPGHVDFLTVKLVPPPPSALTNGTSAFRSLHHSKAQEAFCPSGMSMEGANCRHLKGGPMAVQSVQIVKQIVKETSCPVGMVLDGHKCVGQHICPPRMLCPPATTMTPAGNCVAAAPPQLTCPAGLSMMAGRCVAMEVTPAALTCPAGFTLDARGGGGAAVCVSSIPCPPRCPPGSRLVPQGDGIPACEVEAPPLSRCPPGSRREGGCCIAIRKKSAQIVCPDGAFMDPETQHCLATQQPAPFCPRGFQFASRELMMMAPSEQESCIQTAPQQYAPCPPGSRQVGLGECERIERYPAEVTCPQGYGMSEDGCQKEVATPPLCPRGFAMTRDGECEQVLRKRSICPEGTEPTPHTDQCRRLVSLPLKVCCPPGFELEEPGDRCRRLERLAPLMSCEGECVTVTSTRPLSFVCPPNFDLAQQPANLYGGREPAEAPDCLPAQMSGNRPGSLDGSGLGVSSVPATMFCPDGGQIEEGRCVTRTPIVPQMKCPMGELDKETRSCVREVIVPAKSICPLGSRRRGNECLTEEAVPADFVCPDGSSERGGICVMSAPPQHRPAQVVRAPFQHRCDGPGQILSAADGTCILPTRMPQQMQCPEGFRETDSGFLAVSNSRRPANSGPMCIRTANMILPPAVEKRVRPCFVCPPDMVKTESGDCIETMRMPLEKECPPGFNPADEGYMRCVQAVEPVTPPPKVVMSAPLAVCPPPTRLAGANCVASREAPALMICPGGFALEGNKCIQVVNSVAVCPQGMQLTPQGCSKLVRAKPKTKLIKGCTHHKPCPLCPQQMANTCV